MEIKNANFKFRITKHSHLVGLEEKTTYRVEICPIPKNKGSELRPEYTFDNVPFGIIGNILEYKYYDITRIFGITEVVKSGMFDSLDEAKQTMEKVGEFLSKPRYEVVYEEE